MSKNVLMLRFSLMFSSDGGKQYMKNIYLKKKS